MKLGSIGKWDDMVDMFYTKYFHGEEIVMLVTCGRPFLQCSVLGLNVLSKGIETSPTAPHFGPVYVQTMSLVC